MEGTCEVQLVICDCEGRWGVWCFKIPEIMRTCNSALEVPVGMSGKDEAHGVGWVFWKMLGQQISWDVCLRWAHLKQRKWLQKDMGQANLPAQCYSPRPWFALLSFVPMLFFWAMWRHHHYGPVLSLLSLFSHDYFGMEIGRCRCALFGIFFEALNFPL